MNNRIESAERPIACPTCGGTPIAELQYGYPLSIDLDALDAGEKILGGCCLKGGDPSWQCMRCGQVIDQTETGESVLPIS